MKMNLLPNQKIARKSECICQGAVNRRSLTLFLIIVISYSRYVNLNIRSAATDDMPDIKSILSQYILETELVDDNIDQFVVAETGDRIVGCACLDSNMSLVELRSIAVLPGWKNKGIGRRLFETLMQRAKGMTDRIYVRTTARGFFEKMGFEALDGSQKAVLWQDCADCDKLDVCMQVPMVLELR
ncbi:MAG: GNAT family N-acetyltransferase [Methanosarcinales archaeon]|nr:GNAT family N-acetyltransferase [Methanosarcinales archaeon]